LITIFPSFPAKPVIIERYEKASGALASKADISGYQILAFSSICIFTNSLGYLFLLSIFYLFSENLNCFFVGGGNFSKIFFFTKEKENGVQIKRLNDPFRPVASVYFESSVSIKLIKCNFIDSKN